MLPLKVALTLLAAIATSPLWGGPSAPRSSGGSSEGSIGGIEAPSEVGFHNQDPIPADAKPFSHANHVPRLWAYGDANPDGPEYLPEVARDCRGCHQFTAGGGVDTPQASCAECHRDQGAADLFPSAGWERDMSSQRTSLSRSFYHDTHAILSCRECHGAHDVVNPRTSLVDVPAHLPIPTSSLSCEVCHGEAVTEATIQGWELVGGARPPAKLTPEHLRQVFAGINDGRIAPPADGKMRPFEHKDHLPDRYLTGAEAGLESQCTQCHIEVTTSGIAEAGLLTVSAEDCGKCHLGEGGIQLQATTTKETRPSASVGTFSHADHFSYRTGERNPDAVGQGAYDALDPATGTSCGACHKFGPVADAPGDFPFVDMVADGTAGAHTYAGCTECHGEGTDQAVWQTAAGLHASAPPAGDGGAPPALGWDRTPDDGSARACTACHEFGEATMATNRGTDEVTRRGADAFGFLGNAHPHITPPATSRPPDGDLVDCSECHVNQSYADLQSRITQRPFRHDVHLSDPTNGKVDAAECLTCHTTAREADSAAALTGPLGGVSYLLSIAPSGAGDGGGAEAQGCGHCHRSTEVMEFPQASAQAATPRDVVHFAHGDHASVQCSECHTLDGTEMRTVAATDCNTCHDHKAGEGLTAWEHTGRIRGTDVESCATCHGTEADDRGIPTRRADPAHEEDPRYQVIHEVFAGFDGNQYHPLPGDDTYRTCNECHAVDRGADQVRRPVEDHLLARLQGSYHAGSSNFDKQAVSCYACHWRRPDDWNSYRDEFTDQRGAENPETRRLYGDEMADFPGPEALGLIRGR